MVTDNGGPRLYRGPTFKKVPKTLKCSLNHFLGVSALTIICMYHLNYLSYTCSTRVGSEKAFLALHNCIKPCCHAIRHIPSWKLDSSLNFLKPSFAYVLKVFSYSYYGTKTKNIIWKFFRKKYFFCILFLIK